MRVLQVDSIELVGGDRLIDFDSGLNIVLGPIATGKSTIVKLLRALFASMPDDFAPEVSDNVTSLRSECVVGSHTWHILRRLVSTDTALVEIVSADETVLASAQRPTSTHPLTLSEWLLTQLDIPVMSVPAAPTRPESDPTPVTFSDYFNYCVLRGDEIDNCVFGHTNVFRDIKRKYVFQIINGLYDASMAELQTDLRAIEAQLTYLRGETAAAARIFAGTELESIEAVRIARESRLIREQELLQSVSELAELSREQEPTGLSLRLELDAASERLNEATLHAKNASAQLSDLESLAEQLKSQEERLTRAAVAGEALVDFDFILCPRCGNQVSHDRGVGQTCNLCLQDSAPGVLPAAFRLERDRIEDQVADTLDLISNRRLEVEESLELVQGLALQRTVLGQRIDELNARFVSDNQERIVGMASERARVRSEIEKYDQFLIILERAEEAFSSISELTQKRDAIRRQLDDASEELRAGQTNVVALEERFLVYLNRLDVPTFGRTLTASIDRRSYLPIVSGRSFDSLSSQGLHVLVNIAYALAIHTVAIDRDLPLPGLLMIDGPSSNVGTEGYDAQRLIDVYALLVEVASEYRDQLQILVVDNRVPPNMDAWIRLTLGEDDRLVRNLSSSERGESQG